MALVLAALAAALLTLSMKSSSAVAHLHESFEDGIGPGIRSMCSACKHHRYPSVTDEQAEDGSHSLKITFADGRTEISTVRFPLGKDLKITWSLFIPNDFPLDHEGTVSQMIGWQAPCFKGGNYHVRIKNGHWGVNIRHIEGDRDDRVFAKKVRTGEWTHFEIRARFTSGDDGYFDLTIGDSSGTRHYSLLAHTRTFVDCPLGPYFKAGLYGHFADGSYLYFDNLEVQAVNEQQ